ncbi:MAG: hypothetical protein M3071_06225 [Actinomycetota bacterium]|nr:hypothetical protein [Actinomycetota bacterium]
MSGQLELMAHLSRWMAEEDVELGGLTPEMADRFLEVRRESASSLRSWRALDPLIGYLQALRLIPKLAASTDSPIDRLVAEYRDYLLRERGLTAGSVAHLERVARLFLAERDVPLEDALRRLSTSEVTGFVGGAVRAGWPFWCVGEDPHERAAVAASVSAPCGVDRETVGAGGAARGGLAIEFAAAAVGG